MRFLTFAAVALALLTACSPPFNWRDVRPDGTPLALLMPCKPDAAQRTITMAGGPAELNMLSCDAGGVTFAVAVADVKDAASTNAALTQWQSATLANMKAAPNSPVAPLKLRGLSSAGVLVKASGQRSNGQPVSSQTAYFAQGSQVFQVVMYADNIPVEVAETYFSGLKFE